MTIEREFHFISGTGINVSAVDDSTGQQDVTVSNSGVTSVAAGTGISVSASTGAVTITNTSPGSSVLVRTARVFTASGSSISASSSATVQTLSVNETSGTAIDLVGRVDINWSSNSTPLSVTLSLQRDGSTIDSIVFELPANTVIPAATDFSMVIVSSFTTSPSGTHSYTLLLQNNSSAAAVNYSNMAIRAYVVNG